MVAILIAAGVLAAGGLTADFVYSKTVEKRYGDWLDEHAAGPDGLRPGYEPFEAGEGGTAILMVHGFGSSPSVFSRMAPELARRGFHCRVMRLPGFGEGLDAYARATRGDWRAAVDAELNRLRERHERVWIMGHSMGGALALDAVRRRPGAAAGLVLVAPLVEVSSRRSLGVPPRMLFKAMDATMPFTRLLETCFPLDIRDPGAAVFDARDRFIPRSVYREMIDLLEETRAASRACPVPLLVALAPGDRVVDSAAAESYFERVDAPARKIVHAERSGHVIPLDFGWEEVAAESAAFVASHSAD